MRIDLAKSPTIYRELEGQIDKIVQGKGPYLYTQDGRVLFDFSGGPCVSSLGHDNQQLIEAITNQLRTVPYVYSGFWGTDPAEKLGELIKQEFTETWPGWFGKVAFACAGNEAVDFACRIAAQYHIERGEPRHVFAARKYSFHGVGLLTSALTDDYGRYMMMTPWYNPTRDNYLIRLPGYHGDYKKGFGTIDDYEEVLMDDIKHIVVSSFETKRPIAGLILEPVGGPPVGAAVPTAQYFKFLRSLCDQYGMLLIFDEVLCGCGRVGSFTAGQHFGVQPDIVILGKGLTSGYLPLSAVVVSKKVLSAIEMGSKVMMVGTTYFNHVTACACGVATLEYLRDRHLYHKVHVEGNEMLAFMRKVFSTHKMVKEIRGSGFLWGMQLAKPDGSAFPPSMQVHKQARRALYDARIVTYSKGQTVDGRNDYLIFAPPFEVSLSSLKSYIGDVAEALIPLERTLLS